MSHAALGPQSPSPRSRLSLAEHFGCAMRQGDAFTQAFGLFDDLADSPHVRLFAHRPNLGGLRCVVFGRQGPNIAGVARVGTDRAAFADVGDVAADDPNCCGASPVVYGRVSRWLLWPVLVLDVLFQRFQCGSAAACRVVAGRP